MGMQFYLYDEQKIMAYPSDISQNNISKLRLNINNKEYSNFTATCNSDSGAVNFISSTGSIFASGNLSGYYNIHLDTFSFDGVELSNVTFKGIDWSN